MICNQTKENLWYSFAQDGDVWKNCVYKKWQLQMTLNLISSISLSGADLMGIGGLFTYWKTATTPTKEMAT